MLLPVNSPVLQHTRNPTNAEKKEKLIGKEEIIFLEKISLNVFNSLTMIICLYWKYKILSFSMT
jgi:hypothetical protein